MGAKQHLTIWPLAVFESDMIQRPLCANCGRLARPEADVGSIGLFRRYRSRWAFIGFEPKPREHPKRCFNADADGRRAVDFAEHDEVNSRALQELVRQVAG